MKRLFNMFSLKIPISAEHSRNSEYNPGFYNQILDKKGTKKILSWFLDNYGPTRTSQFLDELKSVGFHFATEAGLSLGFDDLKVPVKKGVVLQTAEIDIQKCEKRFQQGRITAVERYQKVIDIWTTASENLKDEVIQNFQQTDLFNPLYMMAFSGARGNISQVRQLVGMRGLMSDSAGGIIDFPIRRNFREGLTVTEYAISCYGARKGLIDTALRTADSGYLTRRLVDVAHGIMIGRIECETQDSFDIYPLKTAGKSGSESILLSLEKRILGRILAQDIHKTSDHSLLAQKNQEITPLLATEILQEFELKKNTQGFFDKAKTAESTESILIRSPLSCRHFQNAREDICQLCYGWSLAHGRLVSLGEAVGVLAAQSIGEPGTQLTMRTFHTGGIFSTDIDAKIFAPHDGIISFSIADSTVSKKGVESAIEKNQQKIMERRPPRGKKIRTFHGETAFFLFESVQLKILQEDQNYGKQTPDLNGKQRISIFSLPAQSLVFVYPGQKVFKNTLCAEISHLMNARAVEKKTPIKEKEDSSKSSSANSRFYQLNSSKDPQSSPLLTSLDQSSVGSKLSKTASAESKGFERVNPSGPSLRRFSEAELFIENQDDNFHPRLRNGMNNFISPENLEGFPEVQPKDSEKVDTEHNLPPSEKKEDFGLNISNTKKVLSEIEGQVYFHRLAERRQTTEFENMSLVKGVGSLWILNGKAFKIIGPAQSGDYFLKRTRVTEEKRQGGYNVFRGSPLTNSANSKTLIQFGQNSLKTRENNTKKIHFKKPGFDQYRFNQAVCSAVSAVSQIAETKNLNWMQSQQKAIFPKALIFAFSEIAFKEKNKSFQRLITTEKFKRYLSNKLKKNKKPIQILQKFSQKHLEDEASLSMNSSDRISGSMKIFNLSRLMKGFPVSKNRIRTSKNIKKVASLKVFRYPLNSFSFQNRNTFPERKNSEQPNFLFFQFQKMKSEELKVSTFLSDSTFFDSLSVSEVSESTFSAAVKDWIPKIAKLSNKKKSEYTFLNFEQTKKACFGEIRFSTSSKYLQQFKQKKIGNSEISEGIPRLTRNLIPGLAESSLSISAVSNQLNIGSLDFPADSNSGTFDQFKTQSAKRSMSRHTLLLQKSHLRKLPVSLNKKPTEKRFFNKKIGELIRFGESLTSSSFSSSNLPKNLTMDKTVQILTIYNENYAGFSKSRKRNSRFSANSGVIDGFCETENVETKFTNRNKFQGFLTLRRIHPYLISNDSALAVKHGDIVTPRQFLFELFFEKSKTGDIVQGLPKIEQLFEARRTSLHVMETIHSRLKTKFAELCQKLSLYEATRQSIRFIQRVLIDEIQLVYQSQGVDIADKHIEIIIRQMTSKVIIHEKGQSSFFPDDIIDFYHLEKEGRDSHSMTPVYEPIVLGITKIAFLTESFVSAASFQEAKRVLMHCALQSRVDFLYGLKENVIVGRFIRAGTGFRSSVFPLQA